MAYRIYYKCYCDVPGCEGKGADSTVQPIGFNVDRMKRPLKNGDMMRPFPWRPGMRIPEPGVPPGWRYESVGLYGLWICPKHAIDVKIDGQNPKDIAEDRDTYFKLRGQP